MVLTSQPPKSGTTETGECLTGWPANDQVDTLFDSTVSLQMRHGILRRQSSDVGKAAIVTLWNKGREIHLMGSPSVIVDLNGRN
jgi:hypothetical protein